MIRPMHVMFPKAKPKALVDIMAPVQGKVEELDAFVKASREEAQAQRARAANVLAQAKVASEELIANAEVAELQAEQAEGIAKKMREFL